MKASSCAPSTPATASTSRSSRSTPDPDNADRKTCARIAQGLDLNAHVHFGSQAIGDGGRYSDNIAADALEALIGALWLDLGEEAARAFIVAKWGAMIEGQVAAPKHPKAALQEWALARKRRPPEYRLVRREGPDHAPRFLVAVAVGKLAEAEGEGASKQAAEKAAAEAARPRKKVCSAKVTSGRS